jgi:hypothetical protein
MGGNLGLTRDASHAEFITIPNSDQSRRPNERRCVRRRPQTASLRASGACRATPKPLCWRYAERDILATLARPSALIRTSRLFAGHHRHNTKQ